MVIEFMFFEGCPTYPKALNLLERILKDEGIEASIKMIQVESDAMAQQYKFPGSPTIRINGEDIEKTHRISSSDFGKKCRIYPNEGIPGGIPSELLIRRAVQEANMKTKDGSF